MAQALIRKLDDATIADYRAEARKKGRSLEAELRDLIERNRPRQAMSPAERESMARRLAANQRPGSDSTLLIREAREQRFAS